jgi:hypothetical protein
MTGFQEHFGWACAPDDTACVPLTQSQIETERAIISAMLTIGATVGSVCNPYFVDKYGRVPDMKLACVVFIIGALCCALAPIIWVMYVGRFIAGFSIGMLALCVPVYIGECAPVDNRGQLMVRRYELFPHIFTHYFLYNHHPLLDTVAIRSDNRDACWTRRKHWPPTCLLRLENVLQFKWHICLATVCRSIYLYARES